MVKKLEERKSEEVEEVKSQLANLEKVSVEQNHCLSVCSVKMFMATKAMELYIPARQM